MINISNFFCFFEVESKHYFSTRSRSSILQIYDNLLLERITKVIGMAFHRKGTTVSWTWGQGKGKGKIKECFKDTVHKTIEGSKITRHGTADDPAYYIEQEDGGHVLKLHSELSKE